MTDPVAYFQSVAAAHRRCFWLDGGGAEEWSGRRSFIGWLDETDVSLTYEAHRRQVTRHVGGRAEHVGTDVFEALESELDRGPDDAQWFGYFGYACRPDLPAHVGTGMPDAVWMRARHVKVFEHLPDPRRTGAGLPAQPATPPPADYVRAFDAVQEHLHAGNSYEVNLTYRMQKNSDLDPVSAYLRLRQLNPAPYAGFLQHDVPGARAWLLSSSPERYARITPDRVLETKPMKGTTARGHTLEEDEHLRRRLASEPKYQAENLMIVDLLRNDLAMVCEPGSVQVPSLMSVESYAAVHQLVSTIQGRLRPDVSVVAALRALFPAGSMTGAPKLRTMEIIRRVETTPRGAYAGAFGRLTADGRADLGVTIRSLLTAGDGRYLLGTGGGITVHSDMAEEFAESEWKASRLSEVFAPAAVSARPV
ncbi:anthranilate synthase component I family protein [Streptomyces sp. NPDC057474]|uniref:anthranilate synthase component I family protein n=1 Tax=Streptomyces sp. NPDC057474 TaxID=3346144 RepID=UPI0036C93350